MIRSVLSLAAVLALFAGWPASAQHAGHDAGKQAGTAAAGTASEAYMDAMRDMDKAMGDMAMSGKPGEDFAMMMIPHHQSAVDMARAYLASGEGDPDLTRLCQDIIASQEKEIAFLRDWLARKKH